MSLLPPPRCIETTSESRVTATRVSPPGIDLVAGRRSRRGSRASRRGAAADPRRPRPAPSRAATCSCATYSCGRARMRSTSAARSALESRAPNTGSRPLTGNAGLITRLVEVVDDVGERVRLAAPPGRDRGQRQLLAEQLAAEAGQERQQRRRLDQPAAERVGDRHGAGAHRLRPVRRRRATSRRAARADRRSRRRAGAG